MTHAARKPVVDRPLIDLDLGHAHQYGYRPPEDIPTRPDEQWPTRPLNPTRTPAKESPTCLYLDAQPTA